MSGLIVHRADSASRPQMAETPLSRHDGAATTATDDLFVVHHYEPPPPEACELGRVRVRDLAGAQHPVSVETLRGVADRHVEAVLECAGNGRRHARLKAPGTQFDRGLCGNARWTGISLRDLLGNFAVDPRAATVVAHGLDGGWAAPEQKYARFAKGLPIAKALDEDTILAWALNDEPIPWLHGGPLRLVVPGWAGVWWVKWLSEIALSEDEFDGFWQNERYRYVGGEFDEPEIVREQLPRALITAPIEGAIVPSGPVEIRGKAWSGFGAIVRVEVSVDGGVTWEPAKLDAPSSRWSWLDWRATAALDGNRMVAVCARAVDESGRCQEWEGRRNALGYGNNGIMAVMIGVRHDDAE